jgi:two-component system invasion response regulator UvrY
MIRILIVDDHEIVRRGLKQVLLDEFVEVEFGEAENALTALELLSVGSWQIILLDINIPGRDGLELLGEIKRREPEVPVLVVSGYFEDEFAIQAFKLGASGYLNKRTASDEVIAAVRKVIAGRKYVSATLAEKLAEILGGDTPHEPHESLSDRELQVLRLVASGRSIKEISAGLALSEKTIGTYRMRIAKKLNLSSNVDLTRYALKHRLVD